MRLPKLDPSLRPLARDLLRQNTPLLLVVVASMAAYSAFHALKVLAMGLLADVALEAVDPDRPEGRILSSFESAWRTVLGGEAPTTKLEEANQFVTFLAGMGGVVAALTLVVVVPFFLKDFLAQKIVLNIIARTRQGIVDHLLTQSLGFFHRQKAGDLISRVTNDVSALNQCLRMLFETLIQEPILVATFVTAMLVSSWKLALVVLPFYLLLFVPIIRQGRKVKRYGKRSLEKLGEVTEDLQQLFTGMRTVKAFGMEEHERQDFQAKNREYVRKSLRMAQAKIIGRTIQELSYNLGTVGFLFLVALLVQYKVARMDAGTMVVFIVAMAQMYNPVKAITRAWNGLQESKGGYDRIVELLRSRPRLVDAPGAQEFAGVRQEIAFEGVSFSYDGSHPLAAPGSNGAAPVDVPRALHPPGSPAEGLGLLGPAVLREVSFRVRSGQVVAIVGPSGSGKSTLMDLLARFYDPTAGAITIDGVDIRSYRHGSYLRAIATVSQDPFLFNATIEENIAYGRKGASRAEVEEAARKAFAHEFILEQPQGYATRIGERGVLLSGGQRQRITIARAILKDAPILILDEATSALDSAAEREVQEALENLMADRTTFIIAHRLSTVTHADTMLVLEEGRLVEEGTHEGLLTRRGRYWELYRLQNLEGPAAGGLS